jgi:predicted nicotinamide N-methyase
MHSRHDDDKLRYRIGRNYQTCTKSLRVGALTIPFTRIADPDHVMDQVFVEEDRREKLSGRATPDDQLHMPYWAQLWDSALALAEDLAHRSALQGAAVLDLGCGMGLAGTVAAALGAHVLFGDLEPPALLLAQLNSLPYAPRVRTRCLDWRTTELGETFALILGADIVYERAQWPALESFWRRHLAARGTVLLSEPHRQSGDLFIPWIQQRGWHLAHHEQSLPTPPKSIRIFELQL